MEMIRCPICHTNFRRKDIVTIDVVHTISHVKCLYENPSKFTLDIKEHGNYKDIVSKYEVFADVTNKGTLS